MSPMTGFFRSLLAGDSGRKNREQAGSSPTLVKVILKTNWTKNRPRLAATMSRGSPAMSLTGANSALFYLGFTAAASRSSTGMRIP
jgi:hypothetical protein